MSSQHVSHKDISNNLLKCHVDIHFLCFRAHVDLRIYIFITYLKFSYEISNFEKFSETTLSLLQKREFLSRKSINFNLFTSYVSTSAINPLGNAIANETIAANSPSFASAVLILKTLDKFFRWFMASSSISADAPVAMPRSTTFS